MGSPHLLAFPSSASKGNTSRGVKYSNEKKRARRDSQHVTSTKVVGGNRNPKTKDTSMHKPVARNVRLSNESKMMETNSLSQLGSKPKTASTDTVLEEEPVNKFRVMKGFDLGT
ncbi:hypothetical protein RIF29_26239 [Crotalaria pallida]|uniref:Uncharacterized protein n=1 Tax=Crotalaria pallida TaxID=3830 RepID=A0AAN9EPR0_CROPI